MREPHSALPREVPGGARRADTFLLVVATILLLGGLVGFRSARPPFIPLMMMVAWIDVLARWMQHVRPRYVSAIKYVGTLALGALFYAGLAGLAGW